MTETVQKKSSFMTAIVVLLIAFVVIIVPVGVCAISYVTAFNFGNRMEVQLKQKKEDNKNVLAQYGQKVLEIAQVPDMYKKDAIELTQASIQGRYGKDGSRAMFQMLKEQNPSLDSSMYKKIQQVIESGRNDFQNSQTQLLDIRRTYETALGNFWQGMWLRIAGYPKVNLSDFDIVSTDRADTAFKNKKEDGPIQLRK